MIHTGIDVTSIDRIRAAINPRFLKRLFTEAEAASALAEKDPARHLAGRFAAKEACIKALSPLSSGPIPFREIEVTTANADGPGAQPRVVLRGGAAKLLGGRCLHISISFSGDRAAALAVIE